MQQIMYQVHTLRAMRLFFDELGFEEVLTPPIVENPGMEVHIHPFEVYKTINKESTNKFLQTSPEFFMKKILSLEPDLKNIYTISYSFRDEPKSVIHRPQFIMCEWYRKNSFYTEIMDDCEKLITHLFSYFKKVGLQTIQPIENFQRMTVQELFAKTIDIDILDFLKKSDLKKLIQEKFKEVPLPQKELEWDDYYFLLFLNEVEPKLKKYPYLLIYNFPSELRALSTINEGDPRVCDRFEIYMNGVELCNCFNELVDLQEQKKRFSKDAKLKKEIYNYSLPEPNDFYSTLNRGLDKSSGIALGVERLIGVMLNKEEVFFSS